MWSNRPAFALSVLGLENDILEVAKDDKFGRKLQDAGLFVRKRAPKVSLLMKTDGKGI